MTFLKRSSARKFELTGVRLCVFVVFFYYFVAIANPLYLCTMARGLPDLLKDLEKEYLAVEVLMASFVNKGILPMFITKANDLYEEVRC